MKTIRIVGSANENHATRLDGRYLVEFRPCSEQEADAGDSDDVIFGFAPALEGGGQFVKIVTSSDPERARKFSDVATAHQYWQQTMPEPYARRWPDGKPNRPLTAYHIEIA